MNKERKMAARNHKALFDNTLPFRAKVQKDKSKFTRKAKHKGKRDE